MPTARHGSSRQKDAGYTGSVSPASRQVVVISVIVIIAASLFIGLLLGITRFVLPLVEARQRSTCEALIRQLKEDITAYQQTHGAYPPGPGPIPGMKSPVLDPWGQPLVFRHVRTISGRHGTPVKVTTWNEYRIHSVGPNGIDEGGNGDDVAYGS